MARIRTIKPEFPQSESMGRISREARLAFILMWPHCDDAGRLRASSRALASLLFPFDDDAPKAILGWLNELEREGCITRYEVSGNHYLQVDNFLKHQKIDHPSKSNIPPPSEASGNPREPSRIVALDQGREWIGKESILPADAGLSKPNGHKDAFEDFWKLYPTDKNMSKKTAKTQWIKLPAEKQFAAIGAIPGFRQYCDQNKWYRPIYADRFLAQERFEGYASEPHLSPEAIADQKDRADKLMRRGKYSTGP